MALYTNTGKSTGCKVIEGMRIGGITNATLKFHLPGNMSFEDRKIVPISQDNSLGGFVDSIAFSHMKIQYKLNVLNARTQPC